MTHPIDPIRRTQRTGRDHVTARRSEDVEADTPNLPAIIEGEEAAPPPPPHAEAPAAFFAQLLGQSGQKRGLRGGAPVIDAARQAYVKTEWSGRIDRRTQTGQMKKTEI
jgi:hypothetical protein